MFVYTRNVTFKLTG